MLSVLCTLPDVSKAKKKKKTKQQKQTPSLATVMELVSTKRQGVRKQVKRLQGRLGPGKSKATVKDKRIKSAVGQSARSPTHHIHCLVVCNSDLICKLQILSHNSGRQSRNHPERPAKKSKEPQSLFTEEEFQQFQKEYFGRTVKEKK
uniref:Active regulator of SIRT1 n=1 Tax=Monopterus albus TaxID=43700 RepID=A0A3Q3K1P0_MONAL